MGVPSRRPEYRAWLGHVGDDAIVVHVDYPPLSALKSKQ